jgi:hypothetical protein
MSTKVATKIWAGHQVLADIGISGTSEFGSVLFGFSQA